MGVIGGLYSIVTQTLHPQLIPSKTLSLKYLKSKNENPPLNLPVLGGSGGVNIGTIIGV